MWLDVWYSNQGFFIVDISDKYHVLGVHFIMDSFKVVVVYVFVVHF